MLATTLAGVSQLLAVTAVPIVAIVGTVVAARSTAKSGTRQWLRDEQLKAFTAFVSAYDALSDASCRWLLTGTKHQMCKRACAPTLHPSGRHTAGLGIGIDRFMQGAREELQEKGRSVGRR
jgi:hypothetical protein